MKLNDGKLTFEVDIDGESQQWTADLIVLKLVAEELERKYSVELGNPSIEFLADLASAYESQGCPRCTPTLAHSIWIFVQQQHEKMIGTLNQQLSGINGRRN